MLMEYIKQWTNIYFTCYSAKMSRMNLEIYPLRQEHRYCFSFFLPPQESFNHLILEFLTLFGVRWSVSLNDWMSWQNYHKKLYLLWILKLFDHSPKLKNPRVKDDLKLSKGISGFKLRHTKNKQNGRNR